MQLNRLGISQSEDIQVNACRGECQHQPHSMVGASCPMHQEKISILMSVLCDAYQVAITGVMFP